MERSGERIRMSFLEREIREVQNKLDRLLNEDRSFDRRIQRLEDMKIESNLNILQAKLSQLQADFSHRKTSEQTKAWFWGKIAAFVSFVTSIVVSIWFYVRGG